MEVNSDLLYIIQIYFITILYCVWNTSDTMKDVSIKVIYENIDEYLFQAPSQNIPADLSAVMDDRGIGGIKAQAGDSLRVSYVGYRDTAFMISEGLVSYEVKMSIKPIESVVIFAEERFNRKASLGLQDVPMEFLQAVPSLTGDADIVKTITFLPGVSDGQEGYSHLLVRGGAQDENQILYDGATLFNINHFGGFISMFHSEMVRSVDFYKSYWRSEELR